MTGSWIAGAASQAVHVPKPPRRQFASPLPDDRAASGFTARVVQFPGFDKALRELHAKQILEPEDYYGVARSAREQAFTITADITNKTREQVKTILKAEVANTGDYSQFVKTARAAIEDLPISDRHLQQVYRNAANETYSSGKEAVLNNPIVGDGFPFAKFHAIRDERVRHDHLALEHEGLDGTNVYLRDSEVWRRIRPPLGFNCRCGWAPCSIERAARAGVRFAQEWLDNIRAARKAGKFTGRQNDYRPANVPNVPMPRVFIPPSWERIDS